MTGIATVAAIKHQRRQSPAERRHPHAAGRDGYRSGPMACKAYPRSESTSGSLSSNGGSNLVAWVINLVESHGGTPSVGWWSRVSAWSLGWVNARNQDGLLVGFVNVAWDGGDHGFLVDTKTRGSHKHRGIGRELLRQAAENAKAAGCELLHVDLKRTLLGSTSTPAGFIGLTLGLIHLQTSRTTG
jgi:GNAT superfamily N-acetyltransferase